MRYVVCLLVFRVEFISFKFFLCLYFCFSAPTVYLSWSLMDSVFAESFVLTLASWDKKTIFRGERLPRLSHIYLSLKASSLFFFAQHQCWIEIPFILVNKTFCLVFAAAPCLLDGKCRVELTTCCRNTCFLFNYTPLCMFLHFPGH
jgi:hypothetical protein